MIRAIVVSAALLMVSATAVAAQAVAPGQVGAPAQVVTKVTSGDTVVVSGIGKVRLAGIQSTDESAFRLGGGSAPSPQPRRDPNTSPTPAVSGSLSLKREQPSRTFLQALVLGKTVRLELDPLAKDKPRAYLFLPDGTLVNAEMLRNGHARIDLSRPFEREPEFRQIEAEARRAGLGIWAGASPPR